MVILQELASVQLISSGDVTEFVFKRVLSRKVVYFAADQHKPGSIKFLECDKRKAYDGTMRVQIEKREQKRPKLWKKYLRNDQNKLELVKFLLEDWSHPTRHVNLFTPAAILFLNCGSQFFRLSLKDGLIKCVSELVCDQEEADTNVFFCSKHALVVSPVCISTVDSDIAIYALYFAL